MIDGFMVKSKIAKI